MSPSQTSVQLCPVLPDNKHPDARFQGSSKSWRSSLTTISPVGTSWSSKRLVIGPLVPWSFLISANRISVLPKKSAWGENKKEGKRSGLPFYIACVRSEIRIGGVPTVWRELVPFKDGHAQDVLLQVLDEKLAVGVPLGIQRVLPSNPKLTRQRSNAKKPSAKAQRENLIGHQMNIQKELKFHSNPGLRKLVLDNDKIKKKMKNELKKKKGKCAKICSPRGLCKKKKLKSNN